MSVSATTIKAKRYPFSPRSRIMAALLRGCAIVLAINWLAQGMRGMDHKELGFRLLTELAITLGLAAAFTSLGAALVPATLAAFFFAHSFGFTFNGQFWVCARYCPSYRGDAIRLRGFVEKAAAELHRCGWLDEAVVIGSTGGGALGTRSDIDLRLVFPKGACAWFRVNLLLFRVRAQAFLRAVPLDAYAYDDATSLRRFDPAEPLVVLLDRRGEIARQFADRRLVTLG
jgi:hypothetical protein